MQKLERTRNTVRNFVWGIVNKIATLLLPFFIRVFIVNYLGKEYLGINNLFSSILNVLNLAELGVGTAMVYAMYKPIAENNTELICSLLNLYKKLYKCIGTIIFILGLALIPFLDYLIKGNVASINIKSIYIIFLADTILSYLMFAYKSSLLVAHQRADVSSNIGTLIQILLNVSQAFLLCIFKNYYVYIIMKPLFTIVNNIMVYIVTTRMFPEYIAKGEVELKQRKDIFGRVGALVGHRIGQTVISSADSLVISAFLGIEILSIYSNYYYIVFFLVSCSSIFFGGMLAGIGNSLVVEDNDKNYELFENVNFITNCMVSWVACCLLCLLQPFMRVWMGEEMLLSNTSLFLIVAYYYTWQFRTTGLFFKDAAGMWREDFLKPYIGAGLNVILNIILVKTSGINGVFISTIFCMLFIYFPWETIVVFKKIFERSSKSFLIKQVLYSLSTLVMCGVTYVICRRIQITGCAEILVKFLICLIIPTFFFVMLYCRTKEFIYICDKVKNILKFKHEEM